RLRLARPHGRRAEAASRGRGRRARHEEEGRARAGTQAQAPAEGRGRGRAVRRASAFLALSFGALAGATARAQDESRPRHPRQIAAPPLAFEPPSPAAHRHRLANGLTLYLLPDLTLPIVRARAYVKAGAALDP